MSYYSTTQIYYTILANSKTTKAQDPRIGERHLQVPLRPRQEKRPQVRGEAPPPPQGVTDGEDYRMEEKNRQLRVIC